ncbi:hypothetical protein WDU94_004597 [Cyamophila willieti]
MNAVFPAVAVVDRIQESILYQGAISNIMVYDYSEKYCYHLPDCDDIGSEIFKLLDQYHDMYSEAYMKWDEEFTSSSNSSDDYDKESSEIETSEDIRNERGVETTPETPKFDQTDAETSKIVPEKRVHFDDKIDYDKPKEVPLNDIAEKEKSDSLIKIRNQELDIDEIIEKIKYKQKDLENEFKSEVNRHKSMQVEIEQMESVGRRYEDRMDMHFMAIVKLNRYGDLLCQRIADKLKRLKCKEKQYNKSVKELRMAILRLLPKQKELKRNEYRLIAVRNLQFKVETTEKNIRRLMKAIENEMVLIQEREFMLNPMSLD